MRRCNARVFHSVRAILRDDAESEDVMQQAYVNAYAHLGDFQGHARLSTWITRIAVHEALARARRSKKWTSLDDDDTERPTMTTLAHPSADLEKSAADREILQGLEDAIDGLPGAFRAVFVLRAVEEMSVTEAAEVLDISEETVKTRLFRARSLLKDALGVRAQGAATQAFAFHLSRCDRVVAAVLRRVGTKS
jgi:RNA polymerase sigma-70 factor (ECF subfamily)